MLSLPFRRLDNHALYEAGTDALARRRYLKARMVAAEARRRRNTMAFEIDARALWGMGRRSKAIDVLLDATRRHPSVHGLWGYCGEYLSELGHLDEATAAFMRAGETGASPCTTDYNLGVIAYRRGRYGESAAYTLSALEAYEPQVDDAYTPDLLRAESAHSMAIAGRLEEAEALYRQTDPDRLSEEVRSRVEAAIRRSRTGPE